jgi:hypothetical protein
MSLRKPWVVLLAVMAVASLSGCAKTMVSASAKTEPFTLEPIEGTELNRLTLEAKAVERIGLKTEQVGVLLRFGGESQRTTVPYGALVYDAKGAAFVYTSPKSLVFVRHPVTVDYVEGDRAVLVDGPPSGTPVVTDGGSELTGIEFGVGK